MVPAAGAWVVTTIAGGASMVGGVGFLGEVPVPGSVGFLGGVPWSGRLSLSAGRTSPAASKAAFAWAWVLPTTLGTLTVADIGPKVRVTSLPLLTVVPAAGAWVVT